MKKQSTARRRNDIATYYSLTEIVKHFKLKAVELDVEVGRDEQLAPNVAKRIVHQAFNKASAVK